MSRAWPLLAVAALLAGCSHSSSRRESDGERASDWRTTTSSRASGGEKALNADIQFGAGRLVVGPAAQGTLYRASLKYDATKMTPQVSYSDGTLHVGVEGGRMHGHRGGEARGNTLDLQLGPDVPLNVDVKFGAGEATLDLGGLTLQTVKLATGASRSDVKFSKPTLGTCESIELQVGAAQMNVEGLGNASPGRLEVQGGAGEVNLDLGGAWRNDMTAKFELGMGGLNLKVPRGVGLRVHKNSILASFEAAEMVKQGDVWVSQGYQTAKRHLDIDIDAAFGSIRVDWIQAAAEGSF